jgi:hypothetical protein
VFARLLIAAVLAALVMPGVAQAHHTAVPVVALDYRNHVVAASEPAGVRASVEDAGRKLRVTVLPGHDVVVAGYEGEPFLRFDRLGVAANVRSKTALGLRLVHGWTVAGAEWVPVSRGSSFAWADARAWAPATAVHGRSIVPWSVPLVVDGRRVLIHGQMTRAAKPPVWPWLVLVAVPLVAAAVAVRRRRWLWAAATGLAAVAGLATLADLGGFAAGGLSVSADRWVLLAVEVTLTVVALGLLARPRARLVAVAALAAFAVLQAVSELAVFRHGVVVSGLPAEAVRAAAALALGAGIGAAALVFLVPTPQSRKTVSHVRIPRKEQA